MRCSWILALLLLPVAKSAPISEGPSLFSTDIAADAIHNLTVRASTSGAEGFTQANQSTAVAVEVVRIALDVPEVIPPDDPIPEPASLALVAAGALALLMRGMQRQLPVPVRLPVAEVSHRTARPTRGIWDRYEWNRTSGPR